MANFDKSGMTQQGINLMGKAIGGATIQFTKLVLGDGEMKGEILDLQGVVSAKQNVDVTRIERKDNQCTVGGELLTSSVKQGFFWRECGLYAMDPDFGEILYNYAYSTKPDYIAASDSGMMEEILVSMIATVGSNTNVDVTIDDSMVFATKKVVDSIIKKQEGTINVKEFKCDDGEFVKGDGIHDDTTGIQAALNFAETNGLTVLVPNKSSEYIISDTIYVGIHANLQMQGTFVFNGLSNKTAIVCGEKDGYSYHKNHILKVKKAISSNCNDYSQDGDVSTGVKLYNFGYSFIDIKQSYGFTVGVECVCNDSKGFYFNTITGGEIRAGVCIQIVSERGGWPNGNTFSGFGLLVLNATVETVFIKQFTRSGSYGANSNIFNDIRFEGKSNLGNTIPVDLNGGSQFVFNNIRAENCCDSVFMRVRNAIQNKVTGVFVQKTTAIDRLGTLADGNEIIDVSKGMSNIEFLYKAYPYQELLYDSSDISRKIGYNGSRYYISDMILLDYDTLNPHKIYKTADKPTVDTNGYFNANSGYNRASVKIDTSICKSFKITLDNDADKTSRLLVALLDAEGNPILNKTPEIRSDWPQSKFDSQLYYYTTNDLFSMERCFLIKVPNECVSAYFILHGNVKNYKLYALEHGASNENTGKYSLPSIPITGGDGKLYDLKINSSGQLETVLLS